VEIISNRKSVCYDEFVI